MTDTAQTPARKDMRPSMRPDLRDDPRARAAARAKELLEHGGSMDEGTDEFYIDPADVPDGWAYEWKMETVLNQEDPSYQVHLARTGWEPVPTERHPSYMPKSGDHPIIRRKGMVLMEKPAVVVQASRDAELRKARNQVRQKEEQLGATPDGTLPRDADARTKPKINKGYEAIAIPD